jgi:hypothetical protein
MALMRYGPFRELDRLADQALAGPRMIRTMPMEALRRGDQFLVALDLPGVKQDDVDVTVERNVVQVSARRQPRRQEGDEVIIDERPQGEFRRQLFLVVTQTHGLRRQQRCNDRLDRFNVHALGTCTCFLSFRPPPARRLGRSTKSLASRDVAEDG